MGHSRMKDNKQRFELEGIEPLQRIEAVNLYCKPIAFRTKTEQDRLEYLVREGNK